ncbi:MAG TPA: MerR family transcriptional regulator [Natronosporangium sp.]
MSGGGWTIDELARRATEALAADGVRAPNGRVSAAPDRRLIRWYATIGLLDRPLRTRGRVARYGERHLLQLLAVKKRQAEGRSLAEIQAELAGATDATLRSIAGSWAPAPTGDSSAVESPAPEAAVASGGGDPDRAGFWRELPRTPTITGPPVSPVPLHPGATLVLYASPTPDDLAAIHAAARPLLDLLAERGLLPDPPPTPHPRRPR